MKTAVVILNWNGEKFLEQFLPPLIASLHEDSAVVVADNASQDGSMEFLNNSFPQVATMQFSKNHGFTGGYNRALLQLDAEYFILLNSDIEVSPDWLRPLEQWMETHPDCGICAPKLLSWYDRSRFEYAGAAGGYIDRYGYPFCRGRLLNKVEKDEGQYDAPAEVFWASGACLMIRSELYRSLGGLDERFFAHMEEIDLCWRAQLSGWKVNIVPESIVYHIGGGTLPQGSPKKLYLNYRNNLLMLDNNLAATFVAEAGGASVGRGPVSEQVWRKAEKRAKRCIFKRMVLDGLSGVAYLLTLKFSYIKAICDAHRDFRKLRHRHIRENFRNGIHSVTGIYDKWIIPSALLHGTKAIAKAEARIKILHP